MEVQIRKLKNEVQDDITNYENLIKRCETNLDRLKSTKHNYDPSVMIERNKTDIEKYKNLLSESVKKLNKIESGLYEDELKSEFQQNEEIAKTKSDIKKKKKKESQLKPKENTSDRNTFQRDPVKEMNYEERRYFRDCESIPDYLREKLDNMSNNMGYIWKDIWCFGYKPPNGKNELTLFEKKNNKFLIHLYDKNKNLYTLFEKDNNGNKKKILSRHITRII